MKIALEREIPNYEDEFTPEYKQKLQSMVFVFTISSSLSHHALCEKGVFLLWKLHNVVMNINDLNKCFLWFCFFYDPISYWQRFVEWKAKEGNWTREWFKEENHHAWQGNWEDSGAKGGSHFRIKPPQNIQDKFERTQFVHLKHMFCKSFITRLSYCRFHKLLSRWRGPLCYIMILETNWITITTLVSGGIEHTNCWRLFC